MHRPLDPRITMPQTAEPWSLKPAREVIKIGTKVVSHGRYVPFQMAEVVVPRQMFQEILSLIAGSGRRPRRMTERSMRCGGQRWQKCALISRQSDEFRPCEAKRLVILAVNRSAAIEFRCSAPR